MPVSLVAVLAVLFPAATATRFAALHTRPHSSDEAARWVEQNLDPNRHSLAVSYKLNLPLNQTIDSLPGRTLRSPWEDYVALESGLDCGPAWDQRAIYIRSGALKDPTRMSAEEVVRRLRKQGVTHAVLIVPSGARAEFDGSRPAMERLGAQRLAAFDPYPDGLARGTLAGTLSGPDQLGYEATRVAWRATGIGPAIEIWAVPEKKARR